MSVMMRSILTSGGGASCLGALVARVVDATTLKHPTATPWRVQLSDAQKSDDDQWLRPHGAQAATGQRPGLPRIPLVEEIMLHLYTTH